ncbi:MAG: hypothetical protein GEU79_03620 [Acidimicrobiia bacterium]|nr:hypothetical protein [Acidimicrobiia bacterium]
MIIDCDTCLMANTDTCDECIVPVLLGAPQRRGRIEISDVEMEAMDNLAAEGLVPPLRLVSGE